MDNIFSKIGHEFQKVIRAAAPEYAEDTLDEMNILKYHDPPGCDKQVFDIYFLFNLTGENKASLEEQFIMAKEVYNDVIIQSKLYNFYYNFYGIFLFPNINELSRTKKNAFYKDIELLGSLDTISTPDGEDLNNRFKTLYHHAIIIGNQNDSLLLTQQQQKTLSELFLTYFIISPQKKRIKLHFELMRASIADQNIFYSAGIALLNTSNSFHRLRNYELSKNILLNKIATLKWDTSTIRIKSEKIVNEFFRNKSNSESIIAIIAQKINKNPEDIFNGSIFSMLYSCMEHINIEELFQKFDEYLKTAVCNLLVHHKIDTASIVILLKEAQALIEKEYNDVAIEAQKNREKEQERFYNYYWKMTDSVKFLRWILMKTPIFRKKINCHEYNVESTEEMGTSTFNFVRQKMLKSYWDHINASIESYCTEIKDEIEKIEKQAINIPTKTDDVETPLIIRLFSDENSHDKTTEFVDLIFKLNCDKYEVLIDKFIAEFYRQPGLPKNPSEIINCLFSQFQIFYKDKLETIIYKLESENILEYYGKIFEKGRDIKSELIQLSKPFIPIRYEWARKTSLFYSTIKTNRELPIDDYGILNNDNYIVEAFNELTPWEKPFIQTEGPFKIEDTTYYYLKNENIKN